MSAPDETLWERVDRRTRECVKARRPEDRCIVCEQPVPDDEWGDKPAVMVYTREWLGGILPICRGKHAVVHLGCWDEGEAWATREGLLWRNATFDSEEEVETARVTWRDFPPEN